MPDCKNCQANKQKPVFHKDLSTARLTRIIKYIVIAYILTIAALVAALIIAVVSINSRWADTVQKANDRWAEYLGECDVYDISYDQDGNGVNIIGDQNEVINDVAKITSESEG